MLIDDITAKYNNVPYMRHEQAEYLHGLINQHDVKNLCELGHLHGKSSVYIAAILKERGYGHLTTFDLNKSTLPVPSISEMLSSFDLNSFVTVVLAEKTWTWDLGKLIANNQSMKFDFCYIDGEHTFAGKALSALLVDMLMLPGGIIVFDDYNWTISNGVVDMNNLHNSYRSLTSEEFTTPTVRLVSETVMPHLGYTMIDLREDLDWIVFKKN